MLACSRDTGTSLTQKNWKERDHSTSVCAVIHCNRNYNVLAVTRIKNLHEKKKKNFEGVLVILTTSNMVK